MARFEDSIGYVLSKEGGYADHPSDPGGATFWGISLRFLEAQGEYGDIDKDGDVDKDDIKALSRTDAIVIYAQKFWKPMKLDLLKPQSVATRCFDMAVNMGIKRGVKIAQRAYNEIKAEEATRLKVDGKLGPKTRKALESIDEVEMMAALRQHHEQYYRDLVEKKPVLEVFLDGWVNRARA
jgi:lysozyme family protein